MTLSEQLYLLFEGAITASQLHGEPWPAEYARQAAEELLAASSIEGPSAQRNKQRETQIEGSVNRGSGKTEFVERSGPVQGGTSSSKAERPRLRRK